ncbi:hypothetical protein [Fodinicurvata sp. EGI_FJ10296]|uniref:hypothetical protein n=1 Tax=Fodinicurvata sp. EGI_FJ10296 TaxID=3231908 RepID=UPI0034570BD0
MAKSSAGKQTGWQKALASAGIDAVTDALESRGWTVLPTVDAPLSDNVDLHIINGEREAQLAVTATNRYGWVSGGSVTESVRDGAPIVNRAAAPQAQADFLVLATPARPVGKRETPDDWRFFILPAVEAESAFRRIVDAVINRPRADGSPREAVGPIMGFVGPHADSDGEQEPATMAEKNDQMDRFAPYESAFAALDRFRPPQA